MPVPVNSIVELANARLQKLHHPVLKEAKIELDVLRLDEIHPVISGNKFFKLKYSLQEVQDNGLKGIISFGGNWSNHLVACAAACRELGLLSIGIIRGERPGKISESLLDLEAMGMQLQFVPGDEYKELNDSLFKQRIHEGYYVVPMGGCSLQGIQGASLIMDLIPQQEYDLVCCSIGTGTMMAGLLQPAQIPVMGFSSLKIKDPLDSEINRFIHNHASGKDHSIQFDYHFGGFGKTTNELLTFMSDLYYKTTLPTDIVYTGKMFYGLLDLCRKKFFMPGTRICAIHSGGLQGNRSVKSGLLPY